MKRVAPSRPPNRLRMVTEITAFVLLVLLVIVVPRLTLLLLGSIAGLVAAPLCCYLYYTRIRPDTGGWGPMWLELVDLAVLMATVFVIGESLFVGVKALLSLIFYWSNR